MPKQRIELIARGVLIRQDSLLVCRNVENEHMFLPGGHVEYGEPASDALVREMQEEANVSVRIGDFLGVFESSFVQARGSKAPKHHHEMNVIFQMITEPEVEIKSAEPQIEFVWLDIKALRGSSKLLPTGILETALGSAMIGSSMSE